MHKHDQTGAVASGRSARVPLITWMTFEYRWLRRCAVRADVAEDLDLVPSTLKRSEIVFHDVGDVGRYRLTLDSSQSATSGSAGAFALTRSHKTTPLVGKPWASAR
jgi:hypothetical protein